VVVFILQSIAVRKVLETVASSITRVTLNSNKFGESCNILSGKPGNESASRSAHFRIHLHTLNLHPQFTPSALRVVNSLAFWVINKPIESSED